MTYFGRPPFWLPAFFLSCRHNPDVQWLLFTDFESTADVPPNVTPIRMQIAELGERASRALGTAIEPQRARRKVCDLKPAYGVIFEDELRGFDFWAHSDLDIVWGHVRQFLTDEFLQDYDVVTSTFRKIAGHFGLFRNTPETNRTFELIPDITAAMSSRKYGHLDENVLTHHLRARVDRTPAPSWPRVYWERELTVTSKYQKALAEGDSLWWRDGRTFDAEGHELMYLHFHKLKPFMQTITFGAGDRPAAFMINRKGFIA